MPPASSKKAIPAPWALRPPVESSTSKATEAQFLAHDIRNWLTVLQVYCDLLHTPGAVANGNQAWMDGLSAAVERGHELIASLLETVPQAESAAPTEPRKLQASDSSRQSSPHVALSGIVECHLPLLSRMAGSTIHLETEILAHTGVVALSKTDFERILFNLAGNAIEAMPDGGQLRIALQPGSREAGDTRPAPRSVASGALIFQTKLAASALSAPSPAGFPKESGKTVVLIVSDTGAGIAPEFLPRIFEAGISNKSAKNAHPNLNQNASPTTRGLGLAIVQQLVRRAGGAVRVHSKKGQGTRLEVELPLVDESIGFTSAILDKNARTPRRGRKRPLHAKTIFRLDHDRSATGKEPA